MGDGLTKKARLAAITSIIRSQSIGSQEELISILKEKGFDLTQATLSRDLKELQVVKIHTTHGYKYSMNSNGTIGHATNMRSSQNIALSVDVSGNLAVVKTIPGFAAAVAATIDTAAPADLLLGCIAGDDTILVILRSPEMYDSFVIHMTMVFPEINNLANHI
ncbi:MAG: hypothetical protein MJY73_00550 [Bacteroidales bacterium]|nr:hypothetical protein [Bacteroidales bacterium]